MPSETDKNYISVFKRKSPLTLSPKRKYAVAVVSPLQKHDSCETGKSWLHLHMLYWTLSALKSSFYFISRFFLSLFFLYISCTVWCNQENKTSSLKMTRSREHAFKMRRLHVFKFSKNWTMFSIINLQDGSPSRLDLGSLLRPSSGRLVVQMNNQICLCWCSYLYCIFLYSMLQFNCVGLSILF